MYINYIYIYTQTFSIFIFSIQTVSRNETPYTFSYLYENFCSAKLHDYIVARGFLRNVTPHTFTVNRGNLVPILSSRIAAFNKRKIRENNDEKWDELDWVTAFRKGCGKEKRDICTWKSTTSEVNEFGSC